MGLLTLAACASTGGAGSGSAGDLRFRAGLAKTKITPAEMGFQSGYASRKKPAERVGMDLWVRALALEDSGGRRVVLVTTDMLGFPPSMARRIRAEARGRFGLDDGALLLTSTHTHSGPVLPERPSIEIMLGLTGAEASSIDAYGRAVEGHVLKTIGEALGRLAPARLHQAHTRADFGVNRRVWKPAQGEAPPAIRFGEDPARPHDPDVPVLWIEGEDGAPRAVVFTYACHATTIGQNDPHFFEYHGDYPGVASARLEEALGAGSVALFVDGAAGDINPKDRGKLELALSNGARLADLVLATARARGGATRPIAGPLHTAWTETSLPLRSPPSAAELEPLKDNKNETRQRHARWFLGELAAGRPIASELKYPILSWRFGRDLTLVALSGEVTVEYALRLKRELGEGTTWVAAYANEVAAYIPSERILAEGGYEAGWERELGTGLAAGNILLYGWATPFQPGVEDRVVGAVRELLGAPPVDPDEALRAALTFHAGFDGSAEADRATGEKAIFTAIAGNAAEARPGLAAEEIRLEQSGRYGGALRFAKRTKDFVFFRGAGNVKYDRAAFSGTVSFWLEADPAGALGPGYADPLEITDKKWNDACFFVDFDKEGSPRPFRFGVFPDYKTWNPSDRKWDDLPEDERPWVAVRKPPFGAGRWIHVVMTWAGFGAGPNDGVAKLYLDGVFQGEQRGRRMYTWDPAKVRINLGKSFVGAVDDLAIFGRALDEREIVRLGALPGGIRALSRPGVASAR